MTRFSSPTTLAEITEHGDDLDNGLTGTDGDDALYGEGGNDQLFNSGGTDLLDGGSGNDTLTLDFLRLTFDANLHRNVLTSNISAGDQLIGGSGTDSILVRSDGSGMIDFTQVSIAPDIENIRLGFSNSAKLTSDQLLHFEILNGEFIIVGSGTYAAFGGRLQGGITFGDGDDVASLLGGGGSAYLRGGGGNDMLTAGNQTGVNAVYGDDGNDVLIAGDNAFTSNGAFLDGGAGNDTLQGGRLADTFLAGPGDDIVSGGDGNDTIHMNSFLTEADQISGGAGIDTISAGGDPSIPSILDLGLAGIATDVERIDASFMTLRGSFARLNQFQSVVAGTIQFTDAVDLVAGGKFQANGYTLEAGGTIDASAATQAMTLRGGAGNDHLLGGSAADRMYSGAGIDQLSAGGGNDGMYFGAAFGTGDIADGGAGTDTLALQGDYSAGASLAGMSNIEVLLVASGDDPQPGDVGGNSFDYRLNSVDDNVLAGATLTIIATGLGTSEELVFDGSAETDGNFRAYAGRGADVFTGGAGNDGFFFGLEQNLTGADRIDGGAGTDTVALRGDYYGANAVVFGDASLTRVEVLALLSSHSNEYTGGIIPTGFDYDVTLADGNVAAGQTLDINAVRLGADESLRFDGRAESDGSLRILSGAGDDQIWGGVQADSLFGGLGADQLDGGAGADTYVYRSTAESTGLSHDTIVFGTGDKIDLSLVDAVAGSTASNETFTFIGGAAFSQTAGELRAFGSGSDWTVEADVNGDGMADLVISVTTPTPLVSGDFIP